MIYTTVADAAAPIARVIAGKRHVFVISHVNPDGDAIGSLIGLGLGVGAAWSSDNLAGSNAGTTFCQEHPGRRPCPKL